MKQLQEEKDEKYEVKNSSSNLTLPPAPVRKNLRSSL
jgi:hypothetical protein